MPLRVSLVEDDRLTGESLAQLIGQDPRFTFVACYRTGKEALREVPLNLPDVLLMDINLPGCSGIECTSLLKDKHPDLPVLILTTYDESRLIFDALRAGANGYLLKRSCSEELLKAIEEVHAGGAPLSMNIARLIVSSLRAPPPVKEPDDDLKKLTSREVEVLQELAKGLPYKEVAEQLGISVSTVNSHVEGIYKKLHVQSRAKAVLKLRPRSEQSDR